MGVLDLEGGPFCGSSTACLVPTLNSRVPWCWFLPLSSSPAPVFRGAELTMQSLWGSLPNRRHTTSSRGVDKVYLHLKSNLIKN